MKTLDYPWDIFVGVSCPNQDARNLAVARDSFASPPRGTSLVLGAIRPSPHAGPLSGSGPAPPGRPDRPALNVCLAWTPLSIPKLGGRTRRHRRTKRCRFFHRPWPHWVEQISFTKSFRLTAQTHKGIRIHTIAWYWSFRALEKGTALLL